ncbi:kinase-like domain-containing protein [Tanacetum coccineum]
MSSPVQKLDHLKIPLKDILEGTNHFSNENFIRQGGFGKIYKGKLKRSGESIDIIARRLDTMHGQGSIQFFTEILMLSKLKHENLVSLIGFCDEGNVKIVVNKYEAKRSLDNYLSDPTLTWGKRLQIYNFWGPKLSGFELSMTTVASRRDRLCLEDVCGSTGYFDPIYAKTGSVTHKSDIYSFGVILFEVLFGVKAITDNRDIMLAKEAKSRYENKQLDDLINPDLRKQMD